MEQSNKTSLLPGRDFSLLLPFHKGVISITEFLADRIREYRNILEKNDPEKRTLNSLLISFFIILPHWTKYNPFNSFFWGGVLSRTRGILHWLLQQSCNRQPREIRLLYEVINYNLMQFSFLYFCCGMFEACFLLSLSVGTACASSSI